MVRRLVYRWGPAAQLRASFSGFVLGLHSKATPLERLALVWPDSRKSGSAQVIMARPIVA